MYVHQVIWGCCIVFDIDGMLFEFVMNFLNIGKNIILGIFLFKMSCFLRVSCYFQHLKKIGAKKKFRGGGEVLKTIISHFTFYAIFTIKKIILKKAPSLTG